MKAISRTVLFAIFVLHFTFSSFTAFAHDKIKTVVGGGPNGVSALSVNLPNIGQIAIDAEGNLYILSTDSSNSGAVYKWSHGFVTHIAGDHTYYQYPGVWPGDSFNGDSGPATKVEVSGLLGIAVDNAIPANVYISDSSSCLVRKIDQGTGQISTILGSHCRLPGEDGATPEGLALNPRNGDLYVSQYYGDTYVVPGPSSTTRLGATQAPGLDCSASNGYGYPQNCLQSLALDASVTPANLYIGFDCRVDEVVGATGLAYTVAGSVSGCGSTDSPVATHGQFNQIQQIFVTGNGSTAKVLVADGGNGTIRQFTVTSIGDVPHPGALSTVAGTTRSCKPATTVALNACINPTGVAADKNGNIFIADNGHEAIRKVTPSGVFSTVMGWEASPGFAVPGSKPEAVINNPGQSIALGGPSGVFADPTSPYVFIAGGVDNNVYLFNSATGRISDFAGNGSPGFAGDGKSAVAPGAELSFPVNMAQDSGGNLYIADSGNCRIRVVSAATGILSTFAGTSTCGYSGDHGPVTQAQFDHPAGVAFDMQGNLFVADTNNCAIRRIDGHTHIVTTVAGGLPAAQCLSSGSFSGDGGPASQAQLWLPSAVSFDGFGNLYLADTGNAVVRQISPAGIIQTVAGIGGNPGYNGDAGLDGSGRATQAQLNLPSAVKADANGNLFVSDTYNNILRWITPAGQIITFAGIPPSLYDETFYNRGLEGDGGGARNAALYSPYGLDQDALGNFYVADGVNNRIRQISAFPGYGLSTTSLRFDTQKTGTVSAAQTIRLSAIGPLKISLLIIGHGFEETDNCARTELSAGQSCEIQVRYQPKAGGSSTGSLRVYSNALLTSDGSGVDNGNPNTVTLSGTPQP